MKTLNIRATIGDLNESRVNIDIEPIAQDLFSSLELIGIYEFIKEQYGDKEATALLIKAYYSEKGIGLKLKIIKGKYHFSVKDVCDSLKKEELKKAKEMFQGEKRNPT